MCEEAVYDVVALGELLIDFTPVSTDGAGCPTLKANPGGAPGNLLAALSRYGRRTAFLGKVGEDAFGRLLLESLRRAGVQTRGIRLTSSAFTTLTFVTLDAAGDRSFSFARKPGADTQLRWEEVDRSLIQRCRLFHFGSLSLTDEPARSATRAAVAYARELGRTVTFDPNLRLPLWPSPAEARAQILWSLCQADVVKLSDEEVDFLWGCSPQEGARRLLEECGVSLAMVTLGPRGCYLQNRRGSCALTAPQVSPVDTTGAGDIFGGSALHRLLDFRVPPGGAGPGRPGGDRPLFRHRRQPLHSAPRRHPQHPGAGPGGGPDGRARPPLPMNPLVPSPFPCYNQSFRLEGGGPLPVKEKKTSRAEFAYDTLKRRILDNQLPPAPCSARWPWPRS